MNPCTTMWTLQCLISLAALTLTLRTGLEVVRVMPLGIGTTSKTLFAMRLAISLFMPSTHFFPVRSFHCLLPRTRCVRICTVLNNASKVLQVIIVKHKVHPVLIVHKVKVLCCDGCSPACSCTSCSSCCILCSKSYMRWLSSRADLSS